MDFQLQQKRILTFEEVCEYLDYSKSTVHKLVHRRVIPFSKPNGGKKVYFDREKIEAWMLSNASVTKAETEAQAATYVTTHK